MQYTQNKEDHIVCVMNGSQLKFFTHILFPHLIYGQTNKTISNLLLVILCIVTKITHIHCITQTHTHTQGAAEKPVLKMIYIIP
jgi:hypothetical protein